MGRIETDLTKANLIDVGDYVGTTQKLNYQIKTGDKWNQEGTSTVSFEEYAKAPETALNAMGEHKAVKRLQYIIMIPGKGNHFNDLYAGDKSAGFMQAFMRACEVAYDKDGFDPDNAIGKQVSIEVGIDDDPEYGMHNTFKYSKV